MIRALLLLAAFASAGCYTVRFRRRVDPEPAPSLERTQHTFVNGVLQPSGPTKVDAPCRHGFALVEAEMSVVDGLLSGAAQGLFATAAAGPTTPGGGLALGLTTQLWTPFTTRVTCARYAPPKTGLGLTPTFTIDPPRRYAVVKLVARAGVDQATADLFTDTLIGALRRYPGASVLSDADLASMISIEQRNALLGCDDDSCLSQLGGAVGADRIVNGSIGRVGQSLVMTLAAIDPREARVVASVTERVRDADDEDLLDVLPAMVDRLVREIR